ncbi:MAG: hypothetical protein L0G87_00620 [Renibacterium salmoninarum]|jgi:hypothetical protein|nr:hypothetical protein [Renibacterium salmoninarum]
MTNVETAQFQGDIQQQKGGVLMELWLTSLGLFALMILCLGVVRARSRSADHAGDQRGFGKGFLLGVGGLAGLGSSVIGFIILASGQRPWLEVSSSAEPALMAFAQFVISPWFAIILAFMVLSLIALAIVKVYEFKRYDG